ncbi:MaoC/PaaZ C-terminal domain-containing protein [Demequina sediminicola]|uniref:MaoC/PaaZ C-terminal domain-containing protein n=1 Tax=Demequina sediminicola TaxID=1095026 RepID=UPI0013791464|nr:MaoC/PaaZ C-terminal domain-containing protein [Demequina sediminicola]
MNTKTLESVPGMGAGFARALIPSRASQARMPQHDLRVADVKQDVGRLADYCRVTGFTLRNHVPPTWLHVLTFPLQVHLLGDKDASVRLAGAIHVSNTMTLHRPVSSQDVLELGVGTTDLRPHRKGALVDLTSRVRVDGEVAWEGVSTYLAQGMSTPGEVEERERTPFTPVTPQARWRLSASLGREYRRVSGDPNPIHTSRIAARGFGFPRPIIHGMWTHARALAALEGQLTDSYTAQVDFLKPIFLPGTVGMVSQRNAEGINVDVTDKRGEKAHLRMQVRPHG